MDKVKLKINTNKSFKIFTINTFSNIITAKTSYITNWSIYKCDSFLLKHGTLLAIYDLICHIGLLTINFVYKVIQLIS